jgi:hypothetical protein
LNKENLEKLQNNEDESASTINQPSNNELPSLPNNLLAFDRYSYSFNNPVRYIDPTGHDPTSDPPADWLEWLEQHVDVVLHHMPEQIRSILFNDPTGGMRIIQVDSPHGRTDYWHLNSDLKMLKSINHKDIEPLVAKAAAAASTAKEIAVNAATTVLSVAKGEVFGPFIIITPGMFQFFNPYIQT